MESFSLDVKIRRFRSRQGYTIVFHNGCQIGDLRQIFKLVEDHSNDWAR